jgi:hypothetical protein
VFDQVSAQRSIWWLDDRNPTRLDPPVVGGFANDVGRFISDDKFNSWPILGRFIFARQQPDYLRLRAGDLASLAD